MILRHARYVLLLSCLLLVAAIAFPAPIAASATPGSEADRLILTAETRLGARWSFAATGPNQFDCSGFVFWSFREAGLLDRVGGKRKTAAGYRQWFANNGGTISKSIDDAQPGDVLIWGRDKHAGIYLGDNLAISALVNPAGVSIHRVDKINLKLSAVLHVQLER